MWKLPVSWLSTPNSFLLPALWNVYRPFKYTCLASCPWNCQYMVLERHHRRKTVLLAGSGWLKYVWSSPEPCSYSSELLCGLPPTAPALCSGQKHPATSCFLWHRAPLKWFCNKLPSVTGYLGGQVGDSATYSSCDSYI